MVAHTSNSAPIPPSTRGSPLLHRTHRWTIQHCFARRVVAPLASSSSSQVVEVLAAAVAHSIVAGLVVSLHPGLFRLPAPGRRASL